MISDTISVRIRSKQESGQTREMLLKTFYYPWLASKIKTTNKLTNNANVFYLVPKTGDFSDKNFKKE